MPSLNYKSSRRLTVKDIASMARVSTGTIDRVLHNRGEVSKKTRDKILKIIEENGYQRDILASTLASKKKYQDIGFNAGSFRRNTFLETSTERYR